MVALLAVVLLVAALTMAAYSGISAANRRKR